MPMAMLFFRNVGPLHHKFRIHDICRYTVFATHMESLSELATMYPNVNILHFEVDLRNDRLDFKVCTQH